MRFDEDLSACERVIWAVSDRTGRDPIDLPVLYDSVDTDALNAAVEGLDDGSISFGYAGYQVAIDGDGSVTLTDGDSASGISASGD